MPISVVVGGQYGSEGKGKAAATIARMERAHAVVRVGGTNSGHTAYDESGRRWALRQIPAGIVGNEAVAILPAGSIIDPQIFASEVQALGLGPDRVLVSRHATLITQEDKSAEEAAGLVERIGSTGSGTGAALIRRLSRSGDTSLAGDHPELERFVVDTDDILDRILGKGGRVLVEGTQGFGLSVLHGGHYPRSTARDTTAAAFLSEAGLSPLDVDDVTLVVRAFPIRVAGDSGPLPRETTWDGIARRAGLDAGFKELTTATHKVRRVAEFDPEIVRRAVRANKPTRIVLNHMDYFDRDTRQGFFTEEAVRFVRRQVEEGTGRAVDWIGIGPQETIARADLRTSSRADPVM